MVLEFLEFIKPHITTPGNICKNWADVGFIEQEFGIGDLNTENKARSFPLALRKVLLVWFEQIKSISNETPRYLGRRFIKIGYSSMLSGGLIEGGRTIAK